MSILSTESFIAYAAVAGTDDTDTTANNDLRKAVAANLTRGGYQVVIGAGQTTNKQGFAVRPDPVNPDRNALFFSSALQQVNNGVGGIIRKTLPVVNGEAIIGGFTLFVPNEYVKATAAATTSCLRVVASGTADTTWSNVQTDAGNPSREVFRVSPDLQVRWSTDAAQSQKTLVQGRVAFLEYRISPTDIRVWLDDVLVLQKSVTLNVETIAIAIDTPAAVSGSSLLVGAPGRWSIGNWYNLVEDAVAPNVRLGPTTRIIGVRPDTDIATSFLRPTGYASNAAVMGQDLVDAPAATLQSSNVGDQDIYASSKDTTTASGKLVHGITMKVMASNLESNQHSIRPLIRAANGTESTMAPARTWRNLGSISTKHLRGIARRPTDGKIFACGASIALLSNSQNGAPGTPWTLISDDGGTVTYTAIAFRSDGWGCIGRSDGGLQFIPPGADVPNATIIKPNANTNSINHILVLPNTRFFICTNGYRVMWSPTSTTSTPDVVANWGWYNYSSTYGVSQWGVFSPTLGTGKGRLMFITSVTGGYANAWRSDDEGATWAGAYNGNNTSHYAGTWDSNASTFQMFFATNTNPARKSIDGITWTAPTTGTTINGLVTGAVNAAYFDSDTNQTIIIGLGGTMMVSLNSNDWRPVTRVTTNGLYGICKNAVGDYLAVGDNGTLISYTAAAVDGIMAPLGGYLPYTAVASVNPATGAAWTPADASVSQFGMRLTS